MQLIKRQKDNLNSNEVSLLDSKTHIICPSSVFFSHPEGFLSPFELTSFSSSGLIFSFSFSPWKKAVESSLGHGRHCGAAIGVASEDQRFPNPSIRAAAAREGKDPALWRIRDPQQIPNYHLMADLVTLQIKCLK